MVKKLNQYFEEITRLMIQIEHLEEELGTTWKIEEKLTLNSNIAERWKSIDDLLDQYNFSKKATI